MALKSESHGDNVVEESNVSERSSPKTNKAALFILTAYGDRGLVQKAV